MKACLKSQSSALLLCLAHEANVVTTCQVFVWNIETFWLYEVSCLGDWQSRTLYSNEMLVLFLTNCMCALTHSHVEASLPQEQAKLLTMEQHIPTHTEHSLPQEQAKVVTTGQHIPLHTHTHTHTNTEHSLPQEQASLLTTEQLTPTLHLLLKSSTAERMPAELKCPALAISLPCSTMVCMVSASKPRSISSAWCFFSSSFTPRRSDPRSGLATDFSISTNLSCTTGGTTGTVHLVTEEFWFQFDCCSYLRMKKRKEKKRNEQN